MGVGASRSPVHLRAILILGRVCVCCVLDLMGTIGDGGRVMK